MLFFLTVAMHINVSPKRDSKAEMGKVLGQ